MWQFYAAMGGALAATVYTAWRCERYALIINYGVTCHLEMDPLIKERAEIEESIRKSEFEGFYEEQIAEERKRRRTKKSQRG